MKVALFPGSFDPFTLGHLDILKTATKLFDKVVVAIGHNMQKKGFFTLEKRVEIIENSIKDLENVEVSTYNGLTIEYCNRVGAQFIIRGLRTTTDFESERIIAQANSKIEPKITTLFIPTGHEYAFITSSVVRDVLINGGDISSFMADGVVLNKDER